MTLTQTTREAGPTPRSMAAALLARRSRALPDLVVIVAVGLALRLPAVGFGLPAMLHPDEPGNIRVGAKMAANGDWDPHYFAYPSLMYDVEALAERAQRLFTGHMLLPTDFASQGIGINRTADPDMVLFLRLITVALSVGLCLIVYGAVRRVTGRRGVALSAGLLGATSPLLVTNGVFVTPDTYSAFFTTATLAASLAVARRGTRFDYVLAGIAVGLALGSKYDVLCGAPVLVAYAVREGRGAVRRRALLSLASAAAAAVVAFLVTTPAALFDNHGLVTGLTTELAHYSTGHSGAEGGAFGFYLGTLTHDQFLVLPGAALGVVAACFGRFRKETAVVAAFAVGYFALVSAQAVRFDRDLLPLLPALMLLTGFGLAWLAELAAERLPALPRPAGLGLATVALATALIPAVIGAAGVPRALAGAPRTEAAAWLDAHLPQGAAVVDEHYGPWLDAGRFHLTEVSYVLAAPTIPAGQKAIILTEEGSGRFLEDPKDYPHANAVYRELLSKGLCVTAKYTDGPWVEIMTPCKGR